MTAPRPAGYAPSGEPTPSSPPPPRAVSELETASIPWSREEYTWQLRRPAALRTPIPQVGDRVMFRHTHWAEPSPAKVLAVPEFDSEAARRDVYLWDVATDEGGAAIRDAYGRYVTKPREDPWPILLLATAIGRTETREARLRGSAGWLPLDWQTRVRPLPPGGLIVIGEDR